MIPKNITRRHVTEAMGEIDRQGVPPRRLSIIYDLIYARKRYPPKYVLSLANRRANGAMLVPQEFIAGEAVRFLGKKGFVIERRTFKENRGAVR